MSSLSLSKGPEVIFQTLDLNSRDWQRGTVAMSLRQSKAEGKRGWHCTINFHLAVSQVSKVSITFHVFSWPVSKLRQQLICLKINLARLPVNHMVRFLIYPLIQQRFVFSSFPQSVLSPSHFCLFCFPILPSLWYFASSYLHIAYPICHCTIPCNCFLASSFSSSVTFYFLLILFSCSFGRFCTYAFKFMQSFHIRCTSFFVSSFPSIKM